MANYDDYKTTLNYLLASALDDLEQEDSELCLDREETEQIETYVQDNDCDIINELIDCMKEQIRDKVEEIVENRRKVFNVNFNVIGDINIEISARNEEQLEELCYSDRFKEYVLSWLSTWNIDLEIDHAEEGNNADIDAEDYL